MSPYKALQRNNGQHQLPEVFGRQPTSKPRLNDDRSSIADPDLEEMNLIRCQIVSDHGLTHGSI
jgi:hypothetical protein